MARRIAQFRYFGDGEIGVNAITQTTLYKHISSNYTEAINKSVLADGSIFINYTPIVQLGVQTLPGTKFYLNANTDPIIVGASGIYELDLSNTSTVISSIMFDLGSLELISNNPDGYLIIDIVYEEA